jgi:hypothetical protein
MSELGKRDAAELGGEDDLAKRQMGEAGLNGGTAAPSLRSAARSPLSCRHASVVPEIRA